MNIDWFTFVAQIINFLILVGLLRWFLYGPIVRAMQQREDKIATRWKGAEQRRVEADEKALQYDQKNVEFEQQREDLLKEAHREAHEHRERLTREARDDVEQRRVEWLQSLTRERTEMLDEIRQQLGELAVNATRHTLSELASADLEEWVVRNFVSRIQQLDDLSHEEIKEHLLVGESEFLVRSAFRLSTEWRDQLRDVLSDGRAVRPD
jgi:F-type H+-transporting ATPase subunit b